MAIREGIFACETAAPIISAKPKNPIESGEPLTVAATMAAVSVSASPVPGTQTRCASSVDVQSAVTTAARCARTVGYSLHGGAAIVCIDSLSKGIWRSVGC